MQTWSCSKLRSEINTQGRTALEAGAEQNQPQCSGCALWLPVGNLISPLEVMATRKTTPEERTQSDAGLDATVLFLGERMHICASDPWLAKPAACRLGWVGSGTRKDSLHTFLAFLSPM